MGALLDKVGNQTQDVFDKLSNKSIDKPPNVHDWFTNNELLYIIVSSEAILSTIIVLILAAIHLYFVIRYVTHASLQSDLYWIVFLCPIVSLCGCMGLIIPRTGAFLYSVGTVYLLFCAFILVTIMTTLYGSRKAMCHKMAEKGVRLNPRKLPLGCCLCCIRDIKPSARNLRILECLIFQSPILRVIIEILSMAVYFELENKDNVFFTIASVISLLSMLIASYGSYVLIPAGSKHLTQYRFLTMFRIIDTVQFLYNFQMTILNILVVINFFEVGFLVNFFSSGQITASTKIQFWASFLATQEMLIISCISTYLFRPSKSALFDKYSHSGNKAAAVLPPLNNKPSQNPFVCNPPLAVATSVKDAESGSKQSKADEHKNQSKEKVKTPNIGLKMQGNVENANPINIKSRVSSKNGSLSLVPSSTQPSKTDHEKLSLTKTQSDLKPLTTENTQEQTNNN